MLIKNSDREKSVREGLRGGKGSLEFNSLTTSGVNLKNLRLCSEVLIKPGCSIGEHEHIDETEIYYCLSGSGQVLDGGKLKDINVGDCAITDGANPHSIVNTGSEDLLILAIIILD